MTEQSLLRFALILQDQAPTTLEKYICKLAELVLFDANRGLTGIEICEQINIGYQLSFDLDEITKSLRKKGEPRITYSDGQYFLSDAAKVKLASTPPIEEILESYIREYMEEHSSENVDETALKSLLLRYIYHCFNTSRNNLLSLIDNRLLDAISSFEAENEEIRVLNDFISWNNADKNQFLYQVITVCYEYCMLTVKKDNLLSKRLFQGKRFFLDSNIIFRMSGINNDERQYVTASFVKKCEEVGIQLCCTSATIDEIYRVIGNQVEFIRSLTQGQQPLSYELLQKMNDTEEINDFYKLYYDWAQVPGNRYDDFLAFQRYLFRLVEEAVGKLGSVKSSDIPLATKKGASSDFEKECQDLYNYKLAHRKRRYPSFSSAKTDIINISDIISWRNKNSEPNLWQTNDFLVSADQQLIAWTHANYSGVPVVVLPSVWLSIILRFSGRTQDDYRSFCLFLNQRQHITSNESNINTVSLVQSINNKTSDITIKEKIVIEVTENKAEYNFNDEVSYDANVEKAFDKILRKYYGQAEEKLNEVKRTMQAQMQDLRMQSETTVDLKVEATKESTLVTLSKDKAASKVHTFRAISCYSWLFKGIIFVSWLIGFGIWLYEVQPMYNLVMSIMPVKLSTPTSQFTLLTVVWTIGVGSISAVLGGFVKYMGSVERENKLYKKYYNQQKAVIDKQKDMADSGI